MTINKRDSAADAPLIQQNTVDPTSGTRRPLGEPNTTTTNSLNAPVYGQVISEASEQRRSSNNQSINGSPAGPVDPA